MVPPGMATMLNVADPRAPGQLLSGFYPLNADRRWTERRFSARLKPPRNGDRNGAVLVLFFGIPEQSIAQLHSIEVSADVDGVVLAPERYTKPGDFTYSRDVPASVLNKDAVVASFALDKAVSTGGPHPQELGLNVSTVGFEAK